MMSCHIFSLSRRVVRQQKRFVWGKKPLFCFHFIFVVVVVVFLSGDERTYSKVKSKAKMITLLPSLSFPLSVFGQKNSRFSRSHKERKSIYRKGMKLCFYFDSREGGGSKLSGAK